MPRESEVFSLVTVLKTAVSERICILVGVTVCAHRNPLLVKQRTVRCDHMYDCASRSRDICLTFVIRTRQISDTKLTIFICWGSKTTIKLEFCSSFKTSFITFAVDSVLISRNLLFYLNYNLSLLRNLIRYSTFCLHLAVKLVSGKISYNIKSDTTLCL